MRRPTSAGPSGTVRSAVAARLGASGPTPRASVSPIPALLRPGARPPCWGSRCLSSLIFLRLLVQSSVPSCAPVVVKREPISSSCGDSLVRRARPAPGSAHAQSLVLDLNAGRRAPPAVRDRLRRDAAAAAAGNGRSGVGRVFESRRRPAFRCRAASVAMFALPRAGVRSSGTSPDRRRRYCAASARPSPCGGRYAFHGVRSDPTHGPSQPAGSSIGGIDPSLVRRRQEERLGQGPDSGHGRSCPGVLPPFEIDRARTPASVRQAPAGRANEHAAPRELNSLPRAAGTGTDSRLPRCRFTNDRRPRLLTLPSIVRPPLSRFTVFSSFPPLWSCPAARRPVPQ